jgi:hypothetical protein
MPATRLTFSASATELPPNFFTMSMGYVPPKAD